MTSRLQLDAPQPQSGDAPSVERLRGKGRHWCNCRKNCVTHAWAPCEALYKYTHLFCNSTRIPQLRNRFTAAPIGQFLSANAEKYNTVLIACGTPAACLWLPQAVALPIFFATFLSNGWCSALRCVIESFRADGDHALD